MLLTGALNWMYGANGAPSKECTNLVLEHHFYTLSLYIKCVMPWGGGAVVVVVVETWHLGPLEKGFPSKR